MKIKSNRRGNKAFADSIKAHYSGGKKYQRNHEGKLEMSMELHEALSFFVDGEIEVLPKGELKRRAKGKENNIKPSKKKNNKKSKPKKNSSKKKSKK